MIMPLFPTLLLLFLLVPVAEIYLLIQVGREIGALPTVALVIATAVLGAWLLRRQGLSTLMRARGSLERGELPALEMLEGLILVVGGALLLTPGFVTDAVGFACLVPALRQAVIRRIVASGRWVRAEGGYGVGQPGNRVIDGEFRRED